MSRRRNEPRSALDEALDELYAAHPDDFVETRRRLAKTVREGGDREAAATLASARKPTVAAWALNRLVRDLPDEVRGLLAAGEALREAQAAAIRGEGAEGLQGRLGEARDRIARLTRAARQLLGDEGRASEATLDRISATLMAAVADEEAADELRTGRLTKELEAAGFGFPAGGVAPSVPARKETRGLDERARKRAREALEAAERELAEARERLAESEAAEGEAAAAARRAAREAEAARKAAELAEQELERAAARARRAETPE